MKFKKAQYSDGMSGGKKFLIFLIIVVVIIFILHYLEYINVFEISKKIFNKTKEKTSEFTSDKNKYPSNTPQTDLSWCNTQNVPTTDDETSPNSIQILGTDNIQNCCVKQFSGYNNCINQSSNFEICYDSNIGGSIKYAKLNSKYVNPLYYQTYIKDTHKSYNPNFRKEVACNLVVYT